MRYSPAPSPPPFRERLNSQDSAQGEGATSYGSVQPAPLRPRLFESCDWSVGADKEKQYRHELKNSSGYEGKKDSGRFGSFLSNALYAGQSWFAIALVGILTGIIAGMMQIFKAWLFDFRVGTCVSKGFWYSKYECCQDEPDFNSCKEFVTWGLLFSDNMFIRTVLDRFFYTLLSVLMVVLSAYLVKALCPLARGSGIPELKTILGGFMSGRVLSLTMLLVKVSSLLLAVSSGLCIGMESCFIHISGCISFVVSGFFSKFRFSDAKFRELLTCACAAGISVAFGAPIGGVLFAYETLSSYFPPKTLWRSFFCAIMAELALKLTDPLHQGTLTIFEVTYHSNFKWFEMLPFAFLGMIGGVVGSAIQKCIKRYGTLRRTHRISEHPITEAIFVTVLTAVSSYSFLYAREDSTLLIAGLYDDCRISGIRAVRDLCDADATPVIMFSLSIVIVVKFLGLVLASNLAVPGGHFVPCLVIGACIGRIFGTVVAIIHMHMGDFGFFWECRDVPICVVPGVYAIIGSAAVLTGVTRATLSVVVIIFEITGGLEYIPPTMIVCIISKWAADAFGKASLYDELIKMNNYPYFDQRHESVYNETADDMIDKSKDICAIPLLNNTVASLQALLQATTFSGFPVVTSLSEMHVVGFMSRPNMEAVLQQALDEFNASRASPCIFTSDTPVSRGQACVDLSRWLDTAPMTLSYNTPLNKIVDVFHALRLRHVSSLSFAIFLQSSIFHALISKQILITRMGRLVGIITKRHILQRINGGSTRPKPFSASARSQQTL